MYAFFVLAKKGMRNGSTRWGGRTPSKNKGWQKPERIRFRFGTESGQDLHVDLVLVGNHETPCTWVSRLIKGSCFSKRGLKRIPTPGAETTPNVSPVLPEKHLQNTRLFGLSHPAALNLRVRKGCCQPLAASQHAHTF